MQTVELVEREASQPNGLTLFPLAAAHLEGLVIDGLLLAQPHNYSDALAAEPVPAGLGLCGRLWAHRGAARRVMVDRRSRGAGRRQRADPARVLEHDRRACARSGSTGSTPSCPPSPPPASHKPRVTSTSMPAGRGRVSPDLRTRAALPSQFHSRSGERRRCHKDADGGPMVAMVHADERLHGRRSDLVAGRIPLALRLCQPDQALPIIRV